MVTERDIRVETLVLAESVAEQMRKENYRCNVVQVYMRYSSLAAFQRQRKLPFATCTAQKIAEVAMQLILENWIGEPLRSIGVRVCHLEKDDYRQLSLFPELQADQKQEGLELAVQDLRRRFGHFCVQRSIMAVDRQLSNLDIQLEDSAQSIAFFRG